MFGQTLEFQMALEKDPDTLRTFTYAPANTQRLNDPKGALFFVCEKGKQDIQLSIRVTEEDTKFIIGERSEFGRADTEQAARLIAGLIANRVAADTPDQSETN